MKKRAIFLIVLIIIFGVGISFFMYFPKSIENALNRIKYPFEVGEILASQQIDENLTAVIYTNKEEKSNLQNAIVRKRGIFYDVIVEMSRNVQSGNTQNLKSSAAPVRLPAAPASTPGTSQAAAQAGCVYRP